MKMWLFDIYHDIYSKDMGRKIFVDERDDKEYRGRRFGRRRWDRSGYTVVEEWHTPDSQGDTGDWDFYTFMTYQDAAIFVAQLCMKLNTPKQRAFMRAAEQIATDITKEHKKSVSRAGVAQRKELAEQRKAAKLAAANLRAATPKTKPPAPVTADAQKRVYINALDNGTVKIGISNNVESRQKSIIGNGGVFILQYCYTDMLPVAEALRIEQNCHDHFADRRKVGEFFYVPYDEAKAYLQTLTPVTFDSAQS